MNKNCDIIVVGGGLAGLMATIVACENNLKVKLFTLQPAKRSHSVCAQGGINASLNIKGEGDSPEKHFYETIYGGDFLANQPPVKEMCYNAPEIVYLLDRMGVMFNRTPEGFLVSEGLAEQSITEPPLQVQLQVSRFFMPLMSR